MLNQIIEIIYKMFQQVESAYGTELERYIVARNPQTTYDVEHLTRQYDKQHCGSWPL